MVRASAVVRLDVGAINAAIDRLLLEGAWRRAGAHYGPQQIRNRITWLAIAIQALALYESLVPRLALPWIR